MDPLGKYYVAKVKSNEELVGEFFYYFLKTIQDGLKSGNVTPYLNDLSQLDGADYVDGIYFIPYKYTTGDNNFTKWVQTNLTELAES